MRKHLALAALTLALLPALAKAQAIDPAKDPLKVGGAIYKMLSENDRVRILEVTFKPGTEIALHCHPDHVAAVVTGGKLRIAPEKGEAKDHDLAPGAALYIGAECHSAKNVGTTEIKVVVTELKEKSAAPAAAKAAPATAPAK